jgi:hypothetical protein
MRAVIVLAAGPVIGHGSGDKPFSERAVTTSLLLNPEERKKGDWSMQVRTASVYGIVAVGLAVAVFMTPAVAADMDPAWFAGTWQATAPSPAGGGKQDTFKLTVNPDGTFQENIQSARGGAIVVAGKWRVSGETAILEGTFNGGPYIIDGTKKGHYNNQARPILFARAK